MVTSLQSQSVLNRANDKLHALRWWLEITNVPNAQWEVYSTSRFALEFGWSFSRFNLSGQAITEVWLELRSSNAAFRASNQYPNGIN